MSQEQAMPTNGPWGWYIDHDGRFVRRASKLLEYGETKPGMYHLNRWQERQIIEGLAQRDDLVLSAKSMGRPPAEGWSKEQKEALNQLAETAKAAAKSRDGGVVGTALHTLTERIDRGEDIESVVASLPDGVAWTLRAYEAMRRLNGWRSVEIERTVWLEELEVRGTFDRVDMVPGLAELLGPGDCQYEHGDHGPGGPNGELPVIVDVKTENDPTRNGIHICPQLAIYSRAKKMWRPTGGTRTVQVRGSDREVANGEYVPAPCVRQDVAIVVHLSNGDSNPLFVNLTSGWRAARRFHEQLKDEQAAKRRIGAAGSWFAPVPNVKQDRPGMLVQRAVSRGEGRPDRPETGDVRVTVPVAAQPLLLADGWATTAPAGPGQHEVAVRGSDGLVRWEPQHAVGDTVTVAGVEFTKHSEVNDPAGESRGQLIAEIWRATSLARLSELWRLAATSTPPVSWTGPVAQAGEARRRQIECVQRAGHGRPGVLKCACGWVPGVPA